MSIPGSGRVQVCPDVDRPGGLDRDCDEPLGSASGRPAWRDASMAAGVRSGVSLSVCMARLILTTVRLEAEDRR
jgi:hypothetical protein